MEEVLKDARNRMEKTIKAIKEELSHIRTGRATPSLLDGIKVPCYGQEMPIKQLGNMSVPEPRLLVIQVWDRSIIGEVEKAIRKADLGLNPTSDGNVIRVAFPPLTEERRKDLVRLVKKLAEEGRVAIRNIRRDAIEKIRKMEKEGELPEDDAEKGKKKVQELTDEYIEKVDELLSAKEQEIMEV